MKLHRAHFRDSAHYAAAVASEIAAPILRLAARTMSRAAPTPPDRWRNGVILGNGHIGDVLYRTCSLDLLKRGLPDCKWTYLTTPSAATVLAGNPAIDQSLPWLDEADAISIIQQQSSAFAKLRFDAALCSDNIGHHHAILMALHYGIPNRVGFTRKGLSGLVTHPVACAAMSHAAAFRCMAESITGISDTSALRPRIFPTPQDDAAALDEWTRLGLHDANFVIACSPTTRQVVGTYPADLFVDILRRVVNLAPESRILLSGVGRDREALESIAAEVGAQAVVSAGLLSARAHTAMLRNCAGFLGTDSGSRHMANAAGIPVFFVRNMAVDATGTGVYCATESDIAPPGENLAPDAMRRALAAVDRDAVAAAVVTAARQQARDKRGGIEN